ncbi:hypothetical protein DBR06_SOUSAS6010037, partial [Sousa chinensis]
NTFNKAQTFHFLLNSIPGEFFLPKRRDSSRRNRSNKE